MNLLFEDGGYFDLTTFGLGIGEKPGLMSFAPKDNIVLSGCDEVEAIIKRCGLKYRFLKKNGDIVASREKVLACSGSAKLLHYTWKISQNIFEYMSGIATYTNQMTHIAQGINPNLMIATTRKNFPGAKNFMLKAVMDGGGVVHRIGLFDSILVFKEHLEFFADSKELQNGFKSLKRKFSEKKIAVEVDTYEEANYFASLGADILQCEKMSIEELIRCVGLKNSYPNLLLSATGGIDLKNIEAHAKTGVDFVVTSSPYHAKPLDVKVEIKADRS